MRHNKILDALHFAQDAQKETSEHRAVELSVAYLSACAHVGLELDERDVLARVLSVTDECRLIAHRNRSIGL